MHVFPVVFVLSMVRMVELCFDLREPDRQSQLWYRSSQAQSPALLALHAQAYSGLFWYLRPQ